MAECLINQFTLGGRCLFFEGNFFNIGDNRKKMAQKNEAKVRINHAKTALRILFNSVALRLKAKGIYTNQYFQNTC